jgi:hypothetical protein
MTTHNSTPPEDCKLDPVADAMRHASLAERTAREEFAARTARHTAELEARKRQHEAEVIAGWRASLRATFDPAEDFGDFVAWQDAGTIDRAKMFVSDDYRAGFNRYNGEPWARRTEAGWYYEQISTFTLEAFTLDEQRIIRNAFRDEWARPPSRRWVLLEDRGTVPIVLPHDPAAFVTDYRAKLPEPMRELGIVVGLAPRGGSLHVAVWLGEDRTPFEISAWLAKFNDYESGRFKVREAAPYDLKWVPLEPVTKTRTLAELVFTATESIDLLPSGLVGLDALRGGIQRRGDRIVVQAETGNAKTALALTMAESLAARGFKVAWLATPDEPSASIIARRLQRIGYAYEDAKKHVSDRAALAKLNGGLMVIDGNGCTLEEALAARPDFLFVDNIQKVKSNAGRGLSQHAAVEPRLEAIEASGVTTIVTSRMVRGAGKRGGNRLEGSYGGSAVEGGATVLLDLVLTGAELVVTMRKGRGPGEGESFALELDRAKQTLTPLRGTVAPSELDEVVDEVLGVLADRDGTPLSLRAVQVIARMPRARRKADVLAALKRAVETGRVTKADGKNGAYALQGS